MLPLTLLALVLFGSDSFALRSSTLPEDLHAFPKYKIHFLNGHPVLNVTAQRWLQHGLVDEEEFLGLRKLPQAPRDVVQGIAGGPGDELAAASHHPPASKPAASLERLRLGSADYLCLLLPPPEIATSPEEAQHAHPIQTWELLQPLEGTCLYHRQGTLFYQFDPSLLSNVNSPFSIKGWFSYAYCHGQHVRQFREKEPHLPIGLIHPPLEDPNEPSYTLGHAPTTLHHDEDVEGHISVPELAALANRLELARGAGHRYLTLHWGDGTVCDKTGRKRETEIQFHCSMTTTDSIFFIKETKTCQYTLVIHTPRLCGQPGFKSPREDLRDTPLRCRKVVDTLEGTNPTLPESPLPFQRREPKPLPAPRNDKSSSTGGKKSTMDGEIKDVRSHLIKAALDALLGRVPESGTENGAANRKAQPGSSGNDASSQDGNPAAAQDGNAGGKNDQQRFVAVTVDENGEIRIGKLLGSDGKYPAGLAKDDEGDVMEIELGGGEDAARLMKILREAGYDARLPGQEESDDDAPLKSHDEL